MKNIIIIGDGGHAAVIIDIINTINKISPEFKILGVTSNSSPAGTIFKNSPILGDDSYLNTLEINSVYLAMGLGGFRNNKLRKVVYDKCKLLGFSFINLIHPSAIVSDTVLMGEGITIFPGAVINTNVRIGNNTIIATSSSIDHDTIVGNNVLISAGVTVGADTTIESDSLLALGSKIISGLHLGENTLVAAGAVLINNTIENTTVYGIPAKEKRVD